MPDALPSPGGPPPPGPPESRPAVFISYARKDAARVWPIAEGLAAAGVEVWYDRDLAAPKPFPPTLEKWIREARYVVVMVTARSTQSEWVGNEMNYAREVGKEFLVVWMEDVVPPIQLQGPQRIDVRDGGDPVPALLAALRLAGGTPLAGGAARAAPERWTDGVGRRRGRWATGAVLGALLALGLWTECRPPPAVDRSALASLLASHLWVAYEPGRWRPGAAQREVTPEAVAAELERIAAAGFTGVATFGCQGILGEIPRLAKARGLAVISGVYDLESEGELGRAVRQAAFVDAYCVGYNGLSARHSLRGVRGAIAHLKRRTGRPVTFTERALDYGANAQLAEAGDWIFPDVHLALRGEAGPLEVAGHAALLVESLRAVAGQASRLDKPLMLNAVAYPHAALPGASEAAQAQFFGLVLPALRDPQGGLPVRVSVCPHAAFDAPWKVGADYERWAHFTGLLREDGQPRPAVLELRRSREPAPREPGRSQEERR